MLSDNKLFCLRFDKKSFCPLACLKIILTCGLSKNVSKNYSVIEDKRQVLSSAAPTLAEGAGGSFTYSQFNPLPLFVPTDDNQGYDHQHICLNYIKLL